MPRLIFTRALEVTTRVAAANIILVASAFLWYFYAFNILLEVAAADQLLLFGVNFFGIAIFAVVGAILIDKTKRRKSFLNYWMFIGVLLSFAPLLLISPGAIELIILSGVFGSYFGFGIPVCMGYFAASTTPGNRSILGGITFLCIGIGSFFLSSLGSGNVLEYIIVLTTLRVGTLLTLFFLKIEERQLKPTMVSFKEVLSNKSFLLYFVPWCMFSLVNYMTIPVISEFFGEGFAHSSTIIESILIGVFAILGGLFAAYFGRKRLAIAGFAMLGIGFAFLSLFQRNVIGWYVYTVVDGIAWGAFYTLFLITIWGDLAQDRNSEKYYAIGGLPYLFSNFMRILLGSYVAAFVPYYTVFSFASVFLFLAVLPLVYASETLPEKTMKDRELKSYAEKAQKIKEKYS